MRGRFVVTAAVVALAAAPLAACSDSSVMHMRVGQCILLPEDKSATTATTIDKTSCTREHDAEVFALASAPDGDFPGAVGSFEAHLVGEGVGPVGFDQHPTVIGWCAASCHAPPDTFTFYLLRA